MKACGNGASGFPYGRLRTSGRKHPAGEAREKRYIRSRRERRGWSTASVFSVRISGRPDRFHHPEAEAWYRSLLRRLFDLEPRSSEPTSEKIAMDADYLGMDAARLRNLYALLYQKAAFEETKAATGNGLIWARAGWAGCQRYPLHWGGDAASTWDGLAASIRGGLQLGMSGFGYWASDVGGFHGLPEFMNDGPSDALYLRWTQAMVFASHFRYHGTSDREPYAYPAVAEEVRAWLRLRYALIPYLGRPPRSARSAGIPYSDPWPSDGRRIRPAGRRTPSSSAAGTSWSPRYSTMRAASLRICPRAVGSTSGPENAERGPCV
jgi:alpha-D-xyloside xylohydrolase